MLPSFFTHCHQAKGWHAQAQPGTLGLMLANDPCVVVADVLYGKFERLTLGEFDRGSAAAVVATAAAAAAAAATVAVAVAAAGAAATAMHTGNIFLGFAVM